MKNIFALFIILITTTCAQYNVRSDEPEFIHQGLYTIGGTLSFSTQSFETSGDKKTVIDISPSAGYFLTDRIEVGLTARLNTINVAGTSNTEWGIGPSLRYYFSQKTFAPFVGAGFTYGVSSSSETSDKFITSALSLNAGADYFLTPNVALEAVLGYLFIHEKYPDRYSEFLTKTEFNSREFSLAFGVSIFI